MIAVARDRRQTRPVMRKRMTSMMLGWGAGVPRAGSATVSERRWGRPILAKGLLYVSGGDEGKWCG